MSLSALVNNQMAGTGSTAVLLPTHGSRPDVRHESVFDASDVEKLFPQPVECIQLSPGDFTGTIASVRIGAVTLFEHACNRGIQLRRRLESNTLLIGFNEAARGVREQGRSWPPDEILVVSGGELDLSTLAAADIVWLEVQLDALGPSERESLLRSAGNAGCFISAQTPAFAHLREYVADMFKLCRTNPTILEIETMCQRLEVDLLTQLERTLRTGRIVGADGKGHRRGVSLVQRVEHFMWENVEEPLTLERICANMNCGMRSLIYAFKDAFGLGPMAYLKIRRLNAARRKLKATRGQTRIFDIAADYGFWHMGHFGADYKRMFGMTASETIASTRRKGE
ncbi:MAG: helix-turn-helix domain-containing protein [Vulcanimicrobiaceae bacterium]